MELHEHKCCDMQRVYKGAWTPEEDANLTAYMEAHGNESRSWKDIATNAGLRRCGKSCRFRWLHYLRPSLDRRSFSSQEVEIICNLQRLIGNKWTEIAKFLPGRSDNSIKNFWNAYCKEPPPPAPLEHQQQHELPTASTSTLPNTQQIIFQHHDPSSNYGFTAEHFFTSPVINTSPFDHHNSQSFEPTSVTNYDLAPLPESLPSPFVNTPMLEFGANIDAYDYNTSLFNNDNSSSWINPSYSGNQIHEQPYYLESSCVYDHHLGTQDQNDHFVGNSSFDQFSSDLNLNHHGLMQLEADNVVYTGNNPTYEHSGTHMVAQATDWGLHNSHGFTNTYGENYSLDPYAPFNQHHGDN